jgi:hypothetical protein
MHSLVFNHHDLTRQTPSGLFYRPPDVSVFPRPKYIIVEYELEARTSQDSLGPRLYR